MGTPDTLSGTLDVYAGDPSSFLIEVFDDAAQTIPTNLTGSTFTAQWRMSRSAATAIDLSVTSTSLVGGQITLVVSSAASNAIVAANTGETVSGVFDVQGVNGSVTTTYLQGAMVVTRDVTR
jgi:hypothetical protein